MDERGNGVKDRALLKLHAWLSIGFSGIYCGLVLASALSYFERLGLVGIGIIGMVAAMATTQEVTGQPVMSEALRSYLRGVISQRLGWMHALGTAGITMLALAVAVGVGRSMTEVGLGAAEGIRNAVFLMIGLYVWRLGPAQRIGALVAWIALDVMTFSQVGIPGVADVTVTMIVGTVAGFAALRAQHAIDGALGRKSQGPTVL